MKKEVTFNHILAVMGMIIIPLLVWGVTVEKMKGNVITNTKGVETNRNKLESFKKETNANYNKILLKLHSIELILKDKKDKEY